MKRIAYCYAITAAFLLTNSFFVSAQEAKRITILYDAFGAPSTLQKDWGFAALVEYGGKRILFDTGNNAKIFEHNVKQLGVNLKQLDAVVISSAWRPHERTDLSPRGEFDRQDLCAAGRRFFQEPYSARISQTAALPAGGDALFRTHAS